jgi:hypothetical protein
MKTTKALFLALFITSALQAQFIANNGISLTNTSTIVTNGDWVNAVGSTLRNDGIITTTEDFTNNGTLDPASVGGFVLDFSTDKTFAPGGTSFGFLTKEGTGNATIIGQFTVRDSLSLQGGLITPSSAADVLTVAETGTVSSVPGSFVDGGNLVRQGTGDLFFPVGKDGLELPITFLNVRGTNPSITVEVIDAPAGYTAGPGVDALINFPYAWSTTKADAADTASFVEVQFPTTLTAAANAVLVRKAGATTYEGMGARVYNYSDTVVLIRSYSRGLQGLFSVATGFAGNLETDSLALVNFYNQTGASAWTKDNNWLTGSVGSWQGVTETGGSITALTLDAANITGPMNQGIAEILSLQTVNVAGNNITSIPDFTDLTALTSLNVSNNRLDFASLEDNATLGAIINYTNQKVIGTPATELVPVGADYDLVTQVGGSQNVYTWKRNATVLTGATDSLYTIAAIGRGNMGTYEAEITNPLVNGLTLRTAPQEVLAVATLSGTLSMDATTPATAGTMRLLRVTSGSGYDTTQTVAINTTGAYTFPQVVLDDYQIVGFADTLAAGQARALPTYYQGTLYWEEADTLFVNESRNDLNIISQLEPSAPLLGEGVIAGFVEEDDGLGGRGLGTKRVGGAGVSARRTQGTGRGAEVFELIAYVYTNDEGEFGIEGLVPGTYRLNIQYPGFPMDTESDIDLTIGNSPLDEVVSVEATVAEGKIAVRKLIVTGLYEERAYKAEVFPNPAVEMVQFEFEKTSENRELVLLDAAGKPVKQQAAPEQRGTMIVKELPMGTYLLQVRDGDKVRKVVRVVIE